MRKLIRSILEWAVKEPNYKNQTRAMGETQAPSYSREDFNWHANRIENLETNMSLLMRHLNLRIVNKGKQIEEGQGQEFGGLTNAVSELAGQIHPAKQPRK